MSPITGIPAGEWATTALQILKANGWWEDYWADQRQQWRHRAAIFAEARPSQAA